MNKYFKVPGGYGAILQTEDPCSFNTEQMGDQIFCASYQQEDNSLSIFLKESHLYYSRTNRITLSAEQVNILKTMLNNKIFLPDED